MHACSVTKSLRDMTGNSRTGSIVHHVAKTLAAVVLLVHNLITPAPPLAMLLT